MLLCLQKVHYLKPKVTFESPLIKPDLLLHLIALQRCGLYIGAGFTPLEDRNPDSDARRLLFGEILK